MSQRALLDHAYAAVQAALKPSTALVDKMLLHSALHAIEVARGHRPVSAAERDRIAVVGRSLR